MLYFIVLIVSLQALRYSYFKVGQNLGAKPPAQAPRPSLIPTQAPQPRVSPVKATEPAAILPGITRNPQPPVQKQNTLNKVGAKVIVRQNSEQHYRLCRCCWMGQNWVGIWEILAVLYDCNGTCHHGSQYWDSWCPLYKSGHYNSVEDGILRGVRWEGTRIVAPDMVTRWHAWFWSNLDLIVL